MGFGVSFEGVILIVAIDRKMLKLSAKGSFPLPTARDFNLLADIYWLLYPHTTRTLVPCSVPVRDRSNNSNGIEI
jgi:hypothetical protein